MKKQIVALMIIAIIPALAWIAIAGDDVPVRPEPASIKLDKSGLNYSSRYNTYTLKSQRYASLSLEQQLQTIRAITDHAESTATKR